jgi:hypothetical protein
MIFMNKERVKSNDTEINSEKKRIDYFEIYRNTPPEKKRRSSLEEVWQEVKHAHIEKK